MEETLIQTVISGRGRGHTGQIRRYDKSYRLMYWRLIPVREPSGSVSELIACGTDITAQDQARQLSEAQLQLALEASGVGIWDWDLLTKQLVCTKQMATHLGLSPETSASYERFLACVHPDDREGVKRIHQQTLAEKTDYQTEYCTIWPDGSIHWLLTRGRCIKDLRGNPTHLLGAASDITEVKQAEEDVRESEVRFRRLMDSNIIGIALVDLKGPILEANEAFLSLLGYEQEDVAAGRLRWTTLTPRNIGPRTRGPWRSSAQPGLRNQGKKSILRKMAGVCRF